MPYSALISRLLRALGAVVALCSVLIPSLHSSGAASPANVLLSRGRTEPVVAIDPGNPSIVVGAANTNYSAPVGDTLPTAYFWSGDGGKSFHEGVMPIVRPYTTGADTTVAVAGDGTVFYSYLGETPSYCSGGRSAIVVAHSTDHGRSYRQPTPIDTNPADDKPDLAIRSVKGAPSHLFVAWTRWLDNSSEIWFSRSIDGGAHFARPIRIQGSRLDNFGPVPAVGPDGHVYVFWAEFPEEPLGNLSPTRLLMRVSTDEGRTFGPIRTVTARFPAVPRMAQPGSLRNLTMPAVAVDSRGVISVAWSQARRKRADGSVDADINLSRSADEGRSWSRPIRVNDSRRHDRFMPALTAWPDGSLGIAFYDRRADLQALDVYAARVWPGTRLTVSPNVRINARRAPISSIYYIRPGSTCFSPGRFFGDYIGVAPAPHGNLCVVWADTQLQVYNETDIWFARVHPRRPAPSASAGGAPRDGGGGKES